MKKMVQFFKSKRLYRYSFIAAVILVSAVVVYAATVPYTFTSGTVASSSEVNANFSYLADRSWEKSGNNLYYTSGNVGIGTASPDALLHLYKSAGTNQTSTLKIESDGSSSDNAGNAALILDGGIYTLDNAYGYVSFRNRGVEKAQIHVKSMNSNSGSMSFHVADNSGLFTYSHSLYIDGSNNGNIGIGTDIPTEKLYVAGNIYATGSITQGSSKALKENIKNLEAEKAFSALNELNPVVYNYKADKRQGHVGFIAEDVPAILATKDRKGVSPMDVVALLTKVVQEQQKTISELKKEVEGLKKGRM